MGEVIDLSFNPPENCPLCISLSLSLVSLTLSHSLSLFISFSLSLLPYSTLSFLYFLVNFSVISSISHSNRHIHTHKEQKYHAHKCTHLSTYTHTKTQKSPCRKPFSVETSTQIHFNDSEREVNIQVWAFGRSDFLKTLQL